MELTIEQALQQGVAAHREGKFQDAERLYRAILQSQPGHPDANHNLGVLAVAFNRADSALPLFKAALEANPKIEQFWLSYIDALIKEQQFDIAKQVIEEQRSRAWLEKSLMSWRHSFAKTQKPPLGASPPQELINKLLEHYQSGRFAEAETLSVEITQGYPKHPFAWKVLGAVLQATGRQIEAATANQAAIVLSPQDAEAHSNLGIMLTPLGRLEDAVASYTKAIVLKPDYAEAHYNMGVTLKELGRLEDAVASYTQAITFKPDFAEAHYNLGITLKDLGRLEEAEASYTETTILKPDFAEAHSNLGNTLQELGRLDEAEASYTQAIILKPGYAQAYSNLGNTLQELARLEEAEVSYYQAIILNPNFTEAQLNVCELLEKMNRADELLSFIRSDSRKYLKKKADFLYYEALIEFQKEDYETAAKSVEKIDINELTGQRYISAMKLRGDIYHHKKNYSVAFEAYKSKNKHVKDSPEYKKQEPEKFFIQQREKVAQIKQTQEQSAYKSVIDPSWIQPTFLIGFPRSGTTLLDTILRTHSNIDVLEELAMVNKMTAVFEDTPTIAMIEGMDNTAAEIASRFYFAELEKHINVDKKRTVVDKLPLNILHLPLLNQVFPNAKYILALRHPLDCVLSCWMQHFELNPAMANMIELERVVDFYDVAMSILKLSEERYSLDIHRIRYEDLVLDFEENVSNLLNFLDLKWEEDLRNYQETALAREKSIHQAFHKLLSHSTKLRLIAGNIIKNI